MSNNESARNWCNNCSYNNFQCRDCHYEDSAGGYPSFYMSNSMDYGNYPSKITYDSAQMYDPLKYPSLYSQSSHYDDEWCYGRSVSYSNSNYPMMPLQTEFYPAVDSNYWSKQQQPQQRQQQQQNMHMHNELTTSNYQQNSIGQTTNANSNSDPLNALQNLTVSAGQAAQMVIPPCSANNRMNPTIYNSQIRQRSLASTNLQWSTVPQLTLQMPSSPQVSQLQQGPSSTNAHISNANSVRLPNKSVLIKGDNFISQSQSTSSSIGTPYSLESGGAIISGPQSFPQTLQRPLPNKLHQQSPSLHSIQVVNQPSQRLASSVSTNQSTDISKPNTSMASLNKPTIPISEEESKKVSEEIKKLKEKYLKTVKLMLENRKRYPEKEVKVWKVLCEILENPDAISKPLSLNHITKIEQHLMKAEQSLANEDVHFDLNKVPSSNYQLNQTINKPKSLAPNRKSLLSFDDSSNQKLKHKTDSSDSAINTLNPSSLDLAFDEVFHQLMTADKDMIKKTQKSLVKYVESKRHIYSHFLPKRLLSEDSEEDDSKMGSKRQRLVSIFDEDEFNYLDSLDLKTVSDVSTKYPYNALDKQGLIRTDLIFNKEEINEYNLENEIEILRKEFELEELQEEVLSNQWCTYDTEWGDSIFYSVTYNSQNFPTSVPSLKIRIPDDYNVCQYVDWNLNESLYSPDCGFFLEAVRCNLEENFAKINQDLQWSGVPFVHVASVYKQSILDAKTKYQKHIEQIKF